MPCDWWLQIACGRNVHPRRKRLSCQRYIHLHGSILIFRGIRRNLNENISVRQVKRTRGTSYPWLKENIKGSCRLQSGKWHEAVFVSDNPSLLLNFYQRPTFPRSCLVTLSTWQRLWSSFLCIIFECMNNKARVLLRSHFWEPSRSRNTSTNILWAKVFEFSSRSTLNFSFRVNWITFGRKDASLKTCESKSEWKWAKFAWKKEINEAS